MSRNLQLIIYVVCLFWFSIMNSESFVIGDTIFNQQQNTFNKTSVIKSYDNVALANVDGVASARLLPPPPPPPPVTIDEAEEIANKPSNNLSEEKQIKGNVKDQSGEPVIGAMVIENNNKSNGTVTDIDGNFTLKVPNEAIITISYMGLETQEVNTSSKTTFNIILKDDVTAAEEVVVVGFGTQKKQNLTGAVSQVKMDKVLGDRPVTSVAAALQGAIPGLFISGSSMPGESKKINIRGTTSINGGSPLVLIDNVPGDIDMLNPEDIESVSVLKDASSAAIYGARGAFGVILITTKKSKNNTKVKINYNNNFGFIKPIDFLEQASVLQILETHQNWDNDDNYYAGQNLEQWIGYLNQFEEGTLFQNNPNSYYENGRFIPEGENKYYYLTDNQTQLGIFDNYGFNQTHNASASGGSENITYRMSLGYTDVDGPLILDKDTYSRISVTSYVSAKITDWFTTSLDMRYSKSDSRRVQENGVYTTNFPTFYPTEMMPKQNDLEGERYYVGTPENYLRLASPSTWDREMPRIFSRSVFTPLKDLTAVVEYTYQSNTLDYRRYQAPYEVINTQMGVVSPNAVPTYRNEKSTSRYNALNIYATYQKNIKENHNFKIMAGYNQDTRDYHKLWVTRTEMINPEIPSITGGTGEIKAGDQFRDYSIRSGFYRFNYDYQERYLFELNGRYDGSSKFPIQTRYGFFPSVSAGWNISKEEFMGDASSWMNELKIRGSWGQLGNQAISEYQYFATMTSQLANWIVDGTKPTTITAPGMVRNDFTWEVVETLDIGLDFSFLNNRLTGVVDWYQRDTKGMLAPGAEFPSVVGATAPRQNAADLRTRGWELAIQWQDNIEEWRYSVGFNIYDARTFITKYDNEAGLFGRKNTNQAESLTNLHFREGMELGEIWGYRTDGFYTVEDFKPETVGSSWQLKEGVTGIKNNKNIRPGDIKFQNMNDYDDKFKNMIDIGANTVYDPGDREIIGNNTSRYQFGVNASVGWKGFDFSLMLQGTMKRDVWIDGDVRWPLRYGEFGTIYSHQLDYWNPVNGYDKNSTNPKDFQPANPNPEFPRIYAQDNNAGWNRKVSDKYLLSGAYLRLKNVTISYTIPKKYSRKIGFNVAKVFFSGENILTLDKLPQGVDPERLSWGYPFYATYSFGVSITI